MFEGNSEQDINIGSDVLLQENSETILKEMEDETNVETNIEVDIET